MHRFTSKAGIDLIKSLEGFSNKPYYCPAGILTIGYGHVILDENKYEYISDNDAEDILKKDLFKAERAVIRNINIPLFQNQFDALVSFTFNIGSGGLQRSSLRQKINYDATIDEIKNEFQRWVYSKGKILPGLIKRRQLETMLYVNGSCF